MSGFSVPENWGLWVTASAGSSAGHSGGATEAASMLAGGRWAGRGPFVPHPHTGFRWGELTPAQMPGALPWAAAATLETAVLRPSAQLRGRQGAQPRAQAMEGRVGWLPKACEECLWRSLKLKCSAVVLESASEQADNLSLGTKLCCHPQSVPCLSRQPRAWAAEPHPSRPPTPGG